MSKKKIGCFRMLATGTVEYTITVGKDENGKQKRMRFYAATKDECFKKYKVFLEGKTEYTLEEWLNTWLTVYKLGEVVQRTFVDYNGIVNHITNNRIARMNLADITPTDIVELFADKSNLGQSIRRRMRLVLMNAFVRAIDNGLCNTNPVEGAVIA